MKSKFGLILATACAIQSVGAWAGAVQNLDCSGQAYLAGGFKVIDDHFGVMLTISPASIDDLMALPLEALKDHIQYQEIPSQSGPTPQSVWAVNVSPDRKYFAIFAKDDNQGKMQIFLPYEQIGKAGEGIQFLGYGLNRAGGWDLKLTCRSILLNR